MGTERAGGSPAAQLPELQLSPRRGGLAIPARRAPLHLSVRGSIEANNSETLGQLATAGVGMTRVDAFSLDDELATGALVPLLERFNPCDVGQIHAVFVGRTKVPARVRVFVDYLAFNLR